MVERADFSDEEWEILMAAPNAVAIAVVLVDLAGAEYLEEASAIYRFVEHACARYPDNALVQLVVQDLLSPAPSDVRNDPEGSPEEQVESLLESLRLVALLLRNKGGADATGFKEFLLAMAEHVAEAASEDSSGNARVSPKELALLDRLKDIFDL